MDKKVKASKPVVVQDDRLSLAQKNELRRKEVKATLLRRLKS